MKLRVTFREYELPTKDPDTGTEERGDFICSFNEIIEGETPLKILEIAEQRAKEHSEKEQSDVRVWGTEVVVTPRGIKSY